MAQSVQEIRESLLALPLEERAYLAEELRDSLGPDYEEFTSPMDLHPTWKAELDRRMADFDSGATPGIPWEQVRRELDELVDGK